MAQVVLKPRELRKPIQKSMASDERSVQERLKAMAKPNHLCGCSKCSGSNVKCN
jgi:hypothetical protein